MADFVSSGTENHNSISQFSLFLRHSLYFYHFCRRFFSLFLVTAPCCGMAGVTYLRTAVELVAAVCTISLSVADAVNVGTRLVSQARELTDVARCRRQQQHNNNNYYNYYYYTRLMAYSRSLLLDRGMLFRRLFVLRHRCCSSAATSRRHCMFQSSYSSPRSVQPCDRL